MSENRLNLKKKYKLLSIFRNKDLPLDAMMKVKNHSEFFKLYQKEMEIILKIPQFVFLLLPPVQSENLFSDAG